MPKKRKAPWKKNLLKVPENIWLKLKDLDTNDIIVAGIKKIPESDIKTGVYKHLGIKINQNNEVTFPSKIQPNLLSGRYSKTNLFGKEKVLRDLPKTIKSYTFETPNFGDSSKGYHDVTWTREVYQREFIRPKELEIAIELLEKENTQGPSYVFKFAVDEVLNQTTRYFGTDLLYNLNLLQENTGISDVYESSSTRKDYLRTIYIDWEILPPGETGELVERILSGRESENNAVRAQLTERLDLLQRLEPTQYIKGVSGFRRYFGAQFNDNLVVFENVEYGNAIYIMFDEWHELSQKSRYELLQGFNDKFIRIEHRRGWENRLTREIQDRRR
ncbi:MAG: hypothetical protein K0Q50_934 [Vampirovibrio sp.]|jgi:hypothetical protein|nr:hypothetical protein [Vampirovibrio sp.]